MRSARRHTASLTRLVRLARLGPVGALASVALLATGSDCSNLGQCECFPCQSAVVLNVFDEDSQPLSDWVVEATLDGLPVDVSACDEAVRISPGTCSFGSETGVYRITVQAPGFQTRQLAARFAARSGEDCCSCLPVGATVTAILERD